MLKWNRDGNGTCGCVDAWLETYTESYGLQYAARATPADIIACLRANPDAAGQVLLALESQYIAGETAKHIARASQAESDRDMWRAKWEALETTRAVCCDQMERERDEARATRADAGRLLAEAVAEVTIADLRDRLRIMARVVCEGCGCAPSYDVSREYCLDCWEVRHGVTSGDYHAAACVSVGLRALCGRRILEGC